MSRSTRARRSQLTSRQRKRVRTMQIERLEDRALLAGIHEFAIGDLTVSGIEEELERGIAGREISLDTNAGDQHGEGERGTSSGPRVVAVGPAHPLVVSSAEGDGPLSAWTFQFNQPIEPASVGLLQFTGPGDSELRGAVTAIDVDGANLTVRFRPQAIPGQYHLSLSPSIRNSAGQPTDQNGDGLGGQPDDAFHATAELFSPVDFVTIVTPSSSHLGRSVAFEANAALVGVEDELGGSVSVYRHNGIEWRHEQQLTPSDVAPGDDAGLSVSISGDWALVGAPNADVDGVADMGAAYLFEFDGAQWTQVQKLTINDPASRLAYQNFGYSVSLDGNRAMIGAPHEYWATSGAAYIYEFDGGQWRESDRLTSTRKGSEFGRAVQLEGDRAVVGAPADRNDDGIRTGSLYVFEHDNTDWTQVAKLTPSVPTADGHFGGAVTMNQGTIVAATPPRHYKAPSGTVYIFGHDAGQWTESQRLQSPAGLGKDGFGAAVAMSDNELLIGAPDYRMTGSLPGLINGFKSGTVYAYRSTVSGWELVDAYQATESKELHYDQRSFGSSIATSGNDMLVGAPDYRNLDASGAAFFHPLSLWHAPRGVSAGPVDRVLLRFPSPMDQSSFVLGEDVLAFSGPSGGLVATGVHWQDDRTAEVLFDAQTAVGVYRLTIGPQILDSQGKALDIDRDGIPAEILDDRFVASFAIGSGAPVDSEFSVLAENFGVGGTAGNRTIEIHGTAFDRTVTVQLSDGDQFMAPAVTYYRVDPTTLFATFDLTKLVPGTYDVIVTNGTGASHTISGGLTVVAGGQSEDRPSLSIPNAFRRPGFFPVTASWANDGINDALTPVLRMSSSEPFAGDVTAALKRDVVTSQTFYGADAAFGPPGILLPGQTVAATRYTVPHSRSVVPEFTDITYTIDRPYADTTSEFDWDSFRVNLRPVNMPPELFDAAMAQMQREVGATAGDFLRMLSRNAMLYPGTFGTDADMLHLARIELERIAATMTTSIQGQLRLDDLRYSLANQHVTAVHSVTADTYHAFTLTDGSFQFVSLKPGSYRLESVGGAVFMNTAVTVTVGDGHAVTGIEMEVEPGASISGRLVGVNAELPITAASVVDPDVVVQTTVKVDGRFTIDGLPTGRYALSVPDHILLTNTEVEVVQGDELRGLNVLAMRGASVIGSVADSDGYPVPGTVVYLRGQLTGYDTAIPVTPTGSFVASRLPTDTFAVGIRAADGRSAELPSISVVAGETIRLEQLRFTETVALEGFVRAGTSNTAISGATIVAYQTGSAVVVRAVSDENGRYTFSSMPVGEWQLEVGHSSTLDRAIARIDLNDSVAATHDFSLDTTSRIGGTVVGEGRALEGVTLWLVNDGRLLGRVVSDHAGRYDIAGVPAGRYTLRAEMSGFVSQNAEVIVVSNSETVASRHFSLETGTVLRGTVTQSGTGQGISEARVLIRTGVATFVEASSGRHGEFVMEALPAGYYEADVTAHGFDAVRRIVKVSEQSSEVNVSLSPSRPGTQLRGLLMTPGGTGPVAGARVRFVSDDSRIAAEATSNAYGRFEVQLPLNQSYDVKIRHDAFSFESSRLHVADGGSMELSLPAAAASLQVVATDQSNGVPVADAVVKLYSNDRDALELVSYQGTSNDAAGYRFDHVASGQYTVLVEAAGYGRYAAVVSLANGEHTRLDAELPVGHELQGTVTDSTTGQSLAGVTVRLTQVGVPGAMPTDESISDANGVFRFTDQPAGDYRIEFITDAHSPRADSISIPQASAFNAPLNQKGPAWSLVVVSDDGQLPVAGAHVRVVEGETVVAAGVTDIDGRVELEHVTPEEHVVQVEFAGKTQSSRYSPDFNQPQQVLFSMPQLPVRHFRGGASLQTPQGGAFRAYQSGPEKWKVIYDAIKRERTEVPDLDEVDVSCDAPLPDSEFAQLIKLAEWQLKLNADLVELTPVEILHTMQGTLAHHTLIVRELIYNSLTDILAGLGIDVLYHPAADYAIEVFNADSVWDIVEEIGWDVLTYVNAMLLLPKIHAQLINLFAYTVDPIRDELHTLAQKISKLADERDALAAEVELYNIGVDTLNFAIGELCDAPPVAANLEIAVPKHAVNVEISVTALIAASHDPDTPNELLQFVGFSKPTLGFLNGVVTHTNQGTLFYTSPAIVPDLTVGEELYYYISDGHKHHEVAGTISVLFVDSCDETDGLCCPPDAETCCVNCGGPPGGGGDGFDDGGSSLDVGSMDPNDILGPLGVGDQHWIQPNRLLDYVIRFENDAEKANAPAQVVRVTQTLDDDLDWSSFELGAFAFGGTLITGALGRSAYAERIDLIETHGIYVDAAAGLNLETGEVVWEFTSIDPETGQVPSNPLVGFLPPNKDGVEGQGHIAYSVRPRSSRRSGDVVDAKANIIFDTNDPIATPPIFNTFDSGGPVSDVDSPKVAIGAHPFTVSWSGSDDSNGSGIDRYTIYVAVDGGPLTVWMDDTREASSSYLGEPGHEYAFYSVAADLVGHREAVLTVPGATTMVIESLQNPHNRLDVTGDGWVTPRDALALINYLNARPAGESVPAAPTTMFYDVNGDGDVTPLDVLHVINHLNAAAASEGEAQAVGAVPALDAQCRFTSRRASWPVAEPAVDTYYAGKSEAITPASDRRDDADWSIVPEDHGDAFTTVLDDIVEDIMRARWG